MSGNVEERNNVADAVLVPSTDVDDCKGAAPPLKSCKVSHSDGGEYICFFLCICCCCPLCCWPVKKLVENACALRPSSWAMLQAQRRVNSIPDAVTFRRPLISDCCFIISICFYNTSIVIGASVIVARLSLHHPNYFQLKQ